MATWPQGGCVMHRLHKYEVTVRGKWLHGHEVAVVMQRLLGHVVASCT